MISTLERDNSIEGILFRKMKELPDWYGLTGVGFIWHGEWNDPDVKSALEKELCALKVSFNSGSRELVALRNILRRNEYFPILKQHPVTDKIEKTIPLQVASSREKAVITAPNETQKPFFESKETLPVGQLSIFDYM